MIHWVVSHQRVFPADSRRTNGGCGLEDEHVHFDVQHDMTARFGTAGYAGIDGLGPKEMVECSI